MPVEQRVDVGDHGRGGTVVGRQRIFSPSGGFELADGAAVDRDVAAAERVNRLPRVADHIKRSLRRAEDRGEDFILDRIGVLKFVDDSDRIALPQHGGKRT